MSNKDKKNKKVNYLEYYKNYTDFFTLSLARRVKNLNKKLQEIDYLKKEKKDTLKPEQIKKIERENEIHREIEEKNNIKKLYLENMYVSLNKKSPISLFSEHLYYVLSLASQAKNNNLNEDLKNNLDEVFINNVKLFSNSLANFEMNPESMNKKILEISKLMTLSIDKFSSISNFQNLLLNKEINKVEKVENTIKNEIVDVKNQEEEANNNEDKEVNDNENESLVDDQKITLKKMSFHEKSSKKRSFKKNNRNSRKKQNEGWINADKKNNNPKNYQKRNNNNNAPKYVKKRPYEQVEYVKKN